MMQIKRRCTAGRIAVLRVGAVVPPTSHMSSKPAIPTLFLIPGDTFDARALFAIATAYARAGLLVSAAGKKEERMEMAFPAVICSSFAIELFLKLFVLLTNPPPAGSKPPKLGHYLGDLWGMVHPDHKRLVAGKFRSPEGSAVPSLQDVRVQLFEQALAYVGQSPFVKWRYVHELGDMQLLSHEAITLVLDALGHAAEEFLCGSAQQVNTG
jgi:hypothetical protein